MKILLGIQPTGRLHIGNYFGAIEKWLQMQNEGHKVEIMLASYHANNFDTDTIEKSLRALGFLFVWSQNPYVLDLFYKLAHSERVAELERLPQYHTKERTLHMLSYPLLMACDIILSDCDGVIVWDDQEPHMHYYREVARRHWYKEAITIKSNNPRIMSIKDPTKKMSKSLWDDHCIYIDESEKEIFMKLKKSPTTQEGIIQFKNLADIVGVVYDESDNLLSKEILARALFSRLNTNL